jgi:hypothetical protein
VKVKHLRNFHVQWKYGSYFSAVLLNKPFDENAVTLSAFMKRVNPVAYLQSLCYEPAVGSFSLHSEGWILKCSVKNAVNNVDVADDPVGFLFDT